MRRAGITTLLIAAFWMAAAFSGCGEEPTSDEDEIAALFARYQDAVAARDGFALCGEILDPSIFGDDTEGTIEITDLPPPIELVRSCAQQFERSWRRRPVWGDAPRQTLGQIRVHDDSASARVDQRGEPYGVARFAQVDGRWYLDEIGSGRADGPYG